MILLTKIENQTRTHYGNSCKVGNKTSKKYATYKVNKRRIKNEEENICF